MVADLSDRDWKHRTTFPITKVSFRDPSRQVLLQVNKFGEERKNRHDKKDLEYNNQRLDIKHLLLQSTQFSKWEDTNQ